MAKRRTNLVPDKITAEPPTENLSKEKPEVMDALLQELVEDSHKPVENEEKVKKPIHQDENREDLKLKEYNIISKFKPGDRVKLKPDVKFDIMGRRIHNGIHNYIYTVRLQRDDDMVVIDCLAVMLTMKPEDIEKVDL